MIEVLEISEEVKTAFTKVDPQKGLSEYRFKKAEWDKLFEFYNSFSQKKLNTHCRPCFGTVYQTIKYLLKK